MLLLRKQLIASRQVAFKDGFERRASQFAQSREHIARVFGGLEVMHTGLEARQPDALDARLKDSGLGGRVVGLVVLN